MKHLLAAIFSLTLVIICQTHLVAADTKPLSQSKLSIHLIAHYSAGAKRIVAAGPRVVKVLDLNNEMRAALRDYKKAYPDGKTVLRLYTRTRYELKDDPAASARDFWEHVLWPPLVQLSDEERRRIDYVEGPNEGDSTPTWKTLEDAQWFGKFSVVLASLIGQHGFKPCVGSVPVGNPPGNPDEVDAKLEAFVPALLATQKADGAWSYHAYTVDYTTDVGKEIWYSLRYRSFYDFLRRKHPELAKLPLFLTEGGVDREGNPQTSGFQARGTTQQYENWLNWFDNELSQDPYVLGVTLFQSGDVTGWPSFDIEPVGDWMAEHLRMAK